MYYIKGNSSRGKEVINMLENKGGTNILKCNGSDPNAVYFIGKDGYIHSATAINSQVIVALLCKELTLPEEWKPKLKVGDMVEFVPFSSDGVKTVGVIDSINKVLKQYSVRTDEGLYHWSEEHVKFIEWMPHRGDTVLVKNSSGHCWREAIFSFFKDGIYFTIGGNSWMLCIPFEDDKLGKVTDN